MSPQAVDGETLASTEPVDKYPKRRNAGHPLAYRNGNVYVHREVLYDRIGPGEHACHWCGKCIAWENGSLHADHVDGDTRNNGAGNLVPACRLCNNGRRTGPDHQTRCGKGHLWAVELYVDPRGRRHCRACIREWKREHRANRAH